MTAHRHFNSVPESVLDPIMELDEAFRADPHHEKLNLVVGVFQNDRGESPVLNVVKEAERRLLETEISKVYVPMAGEEEFLRAVEGLVFGQKSALLTAQRVGSVHTPGGTAALRLAAEFLHENLPRAKVWIGEPAYPNHRGIFGAVGIECERFRYFDRTSGELLISEMLADLERASPGDVVLLHGCCHNPTGADMTLQGWQMVAQFLADRELMPFIDLAYLGYASSLEADALGLRTVFNRCPEGIVTTSFSKNFSLYNERTGALSFVASDRTSAERCVSRTRTYIRRIYTSPPAHGGRIIATVLRDDGLRARWTHEVEAMRQRIVSARQQFSDALSAHQVDMRIFPKLNSLNGMFALTGITENQVKSLRNEHHIYMLSNGRISITGITPPILDRLAASISEVVRT
jgi:aspartate/tyrosine/aromatic aminotransferase